MHVHIVQWESLILNSWLFFFIQVGFIVYNEKYIPLPLSKNVLTLYDKEIVRFLLE